MTNNKTAPALARRDGGKRKTSIPMIPQPKAIVQRFFGALGAAGLGLTVGAALPPLLGLTRWDAPLLLAGLALTAAGCAGEVMSE